MQVKSIHEPAALLECQARLGRHASSIGQQSDRKYGDREGRRNSLLESTKVTKSCEMSNSHAGMKEHLLHLPHRLVVYSAVSLLGLGLGYRTFQHSKTLAVYQQTDITFPLHGFMAEVMEFR